MGKGFKKSTRRKAVIFLCFFILYWCTYLFTGHSVTEAGEMNKTAAVEEAAQMTEMEIEESERRTGQEILMEPENGAGQKAETAPEQEELRLYAKAALLMDASNNRVLYEKNGYEVLPMASTTKIMTAILALEYGNLEDEVTVSKKAASMPKVHLGMREGDVFKLKDLLFSLMLESHNDTAVAIAEHIGGSTEGFAELMNQKARDLGCENTWFITPNGLDASQGDKIHSTTAYDLAKIASYAVQNDLFVTLVGTKSYSFSEKQSGRSFTVYNRDLFLGMMDGAIGIKTGFTNQAGYCFVGAVKKNDRTLVSVVLASGWPPHKTYKWADTKELMSMGVEDYSVKSVEKAEIPEQIAVINGVEEGVLLNMEWQEVNMLLADWDEVEVTVDIKENLEAPVEKGEIVGYERIEVNDRLFYAFPIETAADMEEYTYDYCLKYLADLFLYGKEED